MNTIVPIDVPCDPKLLLQFGQPVHIFRASVRQSVVGAMVMGAIAVFVLGFAFFADGFKLHARLFNVAFGLVMVYLAIWIYRLRRWTLLICPKGIIHLKVWGANVMEWTDMVEVVEKRMRDAENPNDVAVDPYEITIVGRNGRMKINAAVNVPEWKEVYRALLDETRQHQIPLRTIWRDNVS